MQTIFRLKEAGSAAQHQEYLRVMSLSQEDRRAYVLDPEKFHGLLEEDQQDLVASLDRTDEAVIVALKEAAATTEAAARALAAADGASRRKVLAFMAWAVLFLIIGAGSWNFTLPLVWAAGWLPQPGISTVDAERIAWAKAYDASWAREAATWAITPDGLYARRFHEANLTSGGIQGIGRCNGNPSARFVKEAGGGTSCTMAFWVVP